MKIKCMHCEKIYDLNLSNKCGKCLKTGGYLQEPKVYETQNHVIKLEETLLHKKSKNQFQIKEIQKNGAIAVLKKNNALPLLVGQRVYISWDTLEEYNFLI